MLKTPPKMQKNTVRLCLVWTVWSTMKSKTCVACSSIHLGTIKVHHCEKRSVKDLFKLMLKLHLYPSLHCLYEIQGFPTDWSNAPWRNLQERTQISSVCPASKILLYLVVWIDRSARFNFAHLCPLVLILRRTLSVAFAEMSLLTMLKVMLVAWFRTLLAQS